MSTTPRKPRPTRIRGQVDDLAVQLASMNIRNSNVVGTGLAYHPCMLGHNCPWDSKHVESAARLERTVQRLFENGLFKKCISMQGRLASEAELLLVHSQEYIDLVRSTMIAEDNELEHISRQFDSVYFCDESHKAALEAVGCCLELVQAICSDKCRNGLSLIRPPGHHAERDSSSGYCIYNNVAITTKYALEKFALKRILIVDWDVHHGQATQNIFYDDDRVLYFSIHQYENGSYWPHLRSSDFDQIGSGNAKGYNVNFPLNQTGLRDIDCITAFNEILMPIALQFGPQLIIVSAGFDSATGDPKGGMCFTPPLFNHLTYLLSSLAEGRLLLCLEGGYNVEVLADCVETCIEALLCQNVRKVSYDGAPHSTVCDTVLDCASVLKDRWSSLDYHCPPSNSIASKWTVHKPEPSFNYMASDNDKRGDEVNDKGGVSSPPSRTRQRIHSHSHATPELKTSVVFDDLMQLHASSTPHPECPERHASIVAMLKQKNLLSECMVLESRQANVEELLLVHDERYVNRIAQTQNMSPQKLRAIEEEFRRDVFINKETFKCAKIAAGALLQVVDKVVNGESKNGFAIVRPPGHHAEADCAMGFCMFNNVAIAAKYAQNMLGVKKILIVDWDIHHGNGIQNMFYEDASVLYISLHRYDNGTFYPLNSNSAAKYMGDGKGRGYNINIPWNRDKMGDDEYLLAFMKIILPVGQQFNPDLVLVSSGFDAAEGDPLGEYHVTSEAYGFMTRMLMTLAEGRVILALEGGYNLKSISEAASQCLSALLSHSPTPIKIDSNCSQRAWETIREVRSILEPHWKCLTSLQRRLIGQPCDSLSKLTPRASKPANDPKSCPAKFGNNEKKKTLQKSSVSKSNIKTRSNVGKESKTSEPGQSHPGTSESHAQASPSSSTLQSNNISLLLNLPPGVADDVGSMFAVEPLSDCPHLCTVVNPPPNILIDTPCLICGNIGENWVCILCYKVHCGRYVKEHGVHHYMQSEHALALSLADLSVWCYPCQAYIHNPCILPIKAKAHLAKFGVEMPS